MVYTHVLKTGPLGIVSPLDRIKAESMAAMTDEPVARESPGIIGVVDVGMQPKRRRESRLTHTVSAIATFFLALIGRPA